MRHASQDTAHACPTLPRSFWWYGRYDVTIHTFTIHTFIQGIMDMLKDTCGKRVYLRYLISIYIISHRWRALMVGCRVLSIDCWRVAEEIAWRQCRGLRRMQDHVSTVWSLTPRTEAGPMMLARMLIDEQCTWQWFYRMDLGPCWIVQYVLPDMLHPPYSVSWRRNLKACMGASSHILNILKYLSIALWHLKWASPSSYVNKTCVTSFS